MDIDVNNVGYGSDRIRVVDCDTFYRVKPVKYFAINQEMSAIHADMFGCGHRELLDKEHRAWMIFRTRMYIHNLASWRTGFEAETWCQEGHRLFFPRAVTAKEVGGGPLFEAYNHWIVLNMEQGRPEKPSYLESRLRYPPTNERWFDPAFPKFPRQEDFSKGVVSRDKVHMDYYDYDYNRHVNNLSYIDWMMASFPFEHMDTYYPSFIDVEWKRQCHHGDALVVETRSKDVNQFLTSIKRIDATGLEEVVFHAVTHWKKRQTVV
jgi:acyl-ACP thioesterase